MPRKKKVNPLDRALSAKEKLAEDKEKLAAKRKAEEQALHAAWKADPTPEKMRPL